MSFLKNVFIKVLKLYNSMLDFNAGIQTQLYADQQSSQDLFFWLAWSRCHKHKHNLLTLPLIISVTWKVKITNSQSGIQCAAACLFSNNLSLNLTDVYA